jgi:hypothetical protein
MRGRGRPGGTTPGEDLSDRKGGGDDGSMVPVVSGAPALRGMGKRTGPHGEMDHTGEARMIGAGRETFENRASPPAGPGALPVQCTLPGSDFQVAHYNRTALPFRHRRSVRRCFPPADSGAHNRNTPFFHPRQNPRTPVPGTSRVSSGRNGS